MSDLIGVLIGLLFCFIVFGIVIIKNDGYFIARNPFFGLEKTKREQKVGIFIAYRMIWFSICLLLLIFLLIIESIIIKLIIVCVSIFCLFASYKHYIKNSV